MTPLVTVVVTVFQRTDFIREAVESVLAQTFSSFEIIVTDDSDSQAVREICASFQRADVLRYRSNPQRLGVVLNLQAAIAEARGKYISILNDDDAWEPNFLEFLVAPLEQDERRIIAFSDHWIMLENGAVELNLTNLNSQKYGRHLLSKGDVENPVELVLINNGVPLAMASVFRKDALELSLLVPEVVGAYDFWVSCLLAASGQGFYYVNERLTRYRLHPKMETVRVAIDKSEKDVFIFQQLLERNLFPQMRSHLQRKLSQALFSCGKDNLFFNNPETARNSFKKSLQISLHWKPVVGLLITYIPRSLRQSIGFTQSKTL